MSVATFLPYKSTYQVVRQNEPKLRHLTPDQFYEHMGENLDPKFRDSIQEEQIWHLYGSPYVKVFPNVCRMMMSTSIEIPAASLTYAYPFFAILIPIELGLPIRSILTGCVDGGHEIRLSMTAQTQEWWDTDGECARNGTAMFFDKGELIETGLSNGYKSDSILKIWRIIICTSFFMMDRHEMVLPDWSRRKFEKWERAKKRNDTVAMSRFLGQAAEERNLTIGKEIELPPPIIETHEKGQIGEEGTKHLTHSHIRRGHMRMQPYGEKHSKRKLIFVPPQIVRPDLPMGKGGHGFKITD